MNVIVPTSITPNLAPPPDLPPDVPPDSPQPHQGRVWAVGLMLVALAAATRLAGLGNLELWLDEVHTFIASTDRLPNLLLWQTIEQQYHSPLPYILVKLSRAVLGGGAWGMRLPSALHGIAAVAALYVMVGRYINWRVAGWSALLLAISPFALEHAREARMYSLWLFWAIVLMGVAMEAVRSASARRPSLGLWFALGLLCMMTHASALHGLTTVAALALWLAMVIVAAFFRENRDAAGRLLLGACVTGVTFLMSWSLAGLGKLMLYLKPPGAGSKAVTRDMAMSQLTAALCDISGTVPILIAALLTLMALAGLVMVAMRRGNVEGGLLHPLPASEGGDRELPSSLPTWHVPLLLIMIALAPLLMFPMAAAKMAFFSRYMQVSVAAWSVGLGALAAIGWRCNGRVRVVTRATVIASLAIMAALWWPHWREIYTVPKMRVATAFAPINQHSQPGQVVIMSPHWGDALTKYHRLGKGLRIVYLPGEGYLKEDAPPEPIKEGAAPPRRTFASVFGANASDRPESAWVFMVLNPAGDPDRQVARLRPLFDALGIDAAAHQRTLADAARGALTLTARLGPQGVDHLVATHGRKR